jgi:hypothetical protein
MNDYLTASMFCGDSTLRTLRGDCSLEAEVPVLKFPPHNYTVLQQGTFP